jgi:hypothetical protein
MYSSLIGKIIPCPLFGGIGEHVLHLDDEVGEMFVRCIQIHERTDGKAQKVLVSVDRLITDNEAQELYLAWRDEIFAQAAKYAN